MKIIQFLYNDMASRCWSCMNARSRSGQNSKDSFRTCISNRLVITVWSCWCVWLLIGHFWRFFDHVCDIPGHSLCRHEFQNRSLFLWFTTHTSLHVRWSRLSFVRRSDVCSIGGSCLSCCWRNVRLFVRPQITFWISFWFWVVNSAWSVHWWYRFRTDTFPFVSGTFGQCRVFTLKIKVPFFFCLL